MAAPHLRSHDPKSKPVDIWPFTRAVDLLYDRISLCKVPRASKFVERSQSGRSNVQIRDVIRVLQSDWPAKILAHGSKTAQAVSQTLPLRVFILKELNAAEGSGLVSRLSQNIGAINFLQAFFAYIIGDATA